MRFKSKLLSSSVTAILAGSGLAVAVAAHAGEQELSDAVPLPESQTASTQGGGACNPCASACNPCNPCAGGGAPLKVSSACVVPRLQKASACNPCNPCAAACNPCNPCAASACNPCNPCAGGGFAELSDAEAADVYGCLLNEMASAYTGSGGASGTAHLGWPSFNTVPYASATHGGRYVNNYSNAVGAEAYGRYEDVGEMPEGSVLAKNSFVVRSDGKAAIGPLFTMEKMPEGWDSSTGDWRYSMVMPDGTVFGVTQGKNSGGMQFCAQCHNAAPETDRLFFLPVDFRR